MENIKSWKNVSFIETNNTTIISNNVRLIAANNILEYQSNQLFFLNKVITGNDIPLCITWKKFTI